MSNILIHSNGTLIFNRKTYRCALGKGGVRMDKTEGDGATPAGCFPIRKVFYRSDTFEKVLETVFPTQALTESDAWSDDATLPEYNTRVLLPYGGSHEKLWRSDHVYDVIVVLGYNDNPPVAGKGSAIFVHIAREGYTPTAGCIALSREDLLEILQSADTETRVCIKE